MFVLTKMDSVYVSNLACFMTLITFILPAAIFFGVLRLRAKGDFGKLVLNGILIFFILFINICTLTLFVGNFIFNVFSVLVYLAFSVGVTVYLILDIKKINSLSSSRHDKEREDFINYHPEFEVNTSRGVAVPSEPGNYEEMPRIFEKVKFIDEYKISDKKVALCPNCKAKIPEDANFCVSCGMKFWRYKSILKKMNK